MNLKYRLFPVRIPALVYINQSQQCSLLSSVVVATIKIFFVFRSTNIKYTTEGCDEIDLDGSIYTNVGQNWVIIIDMNHCSVIFLLYCGISD